MDTIWNCAFGIDIDIQNNPENEYFTKCEKVFSNTEKQNLFTFLSSNILFVKKLLKIYLIF
jgi:hypothetical protein